MKNLGTLLVVAVAGVAAYMLYKNSKKKKFDPKMASSGDMNPPRSLKPNPTSSNNLTDKEMKTVDGLNFGLPYTINAGNLKTGVIVRSRNLVPDVYDRGVGNTVAFDGSSDVGFYHNMSGTDTISIASACKCAPSTSMYKTEIPKLP